TGNDTGWAGVFAYPAGRRRRALGPAPTRGEAPSPVKPPRVGPPRCALTRLRRCLRPSTASSSPAPTSRRGFSPTPAFPPHPGPAPLNGFRVVARRCYGDVEPGVALCRG